MHRWTDANTNLVTGNDSKSRYPPSPQQRRWGTGHNDQSQYNAPTSLYTAFHAGPNKKNYGISPVETNVCYAMYTLITTNFHLTISLAHLLLTHSHKPKVTNINIAIQTMFWYQ